MLASPNDLARFRLSGHRRDLNRPQFKAAALERRLDDPDSDATAVLMALRHALTLRAELPALHPDSVLDVLSVDRVDRVVLRCSHQGHSLVAVHNFTASRLTFNRRLDDPESDATAVLMALRHALTLRAELPALHPDSVLDVLSVDRVDRVVLRCSHQGHSLVAVHNFTASRLTFNPTALGDRDDLVWVDRLTDQQFAPRRRHALEPYAVLWLVQA